MWADEHVQNFRFSTWLYIFIQGRGSMTAHTNAKPFPLAATDEGRIQFIGMKFFLLFLISLFLQTDQQKRITVVQNGWLVYRYGDNLAFLPIKNQAVTPTYENFFTEEKGDGQRMNNSYSAPPKLLIARELPVGIYNYDSRVQKDTFAGKAEFYIQPVKHVYETEDLKADTADYDYGVMSWTFQIKGKLVEHRIFNFMNRSGTIYYLNKQDSLFAVKGGRRKNIKIYPPH